MDGKVALVPWADMLNHSCEVKLIDMFAMLSSILASGLRFISNLRILDKLGRDISGLWQIVSGGSIHYR